MGASKRKRLIILLMVPIGFFLLCLLVLWIMNGGWPITEASGEKKPIHIMKVEPSDGEFVTSARGYCVNFDFRAGNGMGQTPEKSVHYFFDGIDVTHQTDGLINLDIPPSGGLFCYKSSIQVPKGWHTAKVTYKDMTGEVFSYLWRFQVVKN